ncbi:peptidoglycan-binding protein [Streptomyces sp. NPDC059631]|uniref:peptidoglycan-binding protein n=1 Tax=unclassified Streptomyces TaxID=2593676 RepID=UPI0036A291BA
MSISIISRATWGATAWDRNPKSSGPATVSLSQRTEYFVHYDGAAHITRTGYAIPRAIEAEHLAQGWAGIGYNFVVDQAGNIYEGRGWDRQGAHCPGHNISGLGVQVAVGGDQEPSTAALAACRALYDEACRRTGRNLAKKGHKDGFNTLCPGTKLYAWVKAGMPAGAYKPTGPAQKYEPFPGAAFFKRAPKSAIVTAMGRRLVAVGCSAYKSGPGPQWTEADRASYAKWQRKCGYSGADADGWPGKASWDALKVPVSG